MEEQIRILKLMLQSITILGILELVFMIEVIKFTNILMGN